MLVTKYKPTLRNMPEYRKPLYTIFYALTTGSCDWEKLVWHKI